jgi:hypothetical protein
MAGNIKKFLVYGGTILAGLALIVLSMLVSNFPGGRSGFLPQRGFIPKQIPGAIFIFGRHLPGWLGVFSVIGAYLFLYLSGVVVLFLIPRQIGTMRNAFLPVDDRRMWRYWLFFLGLGLLSLVALSLLTGIGLVTDAAFPLPLFMLALLLLTIWIGLITFGLVIGAELDRLAGAQHPNSLIELALGLLVVFALGRLPLVGWLIILLMSALSLGVVVATRLGYGGDWTLRGLEQTYVGIDPDSLIGGKDLPEKLDD